MTATHLGRRLALWLGSFVVIGSVCVIYFRMPLGPLIVAGILTFLLTIIRALRPQAQGRDVTQP